LGDFKEDAYFECIGLDAVAGDELPRTWNSPILTLLSAQVKKGNELRAKKTALFGH
jgi:hypothetical protein